MRERLVRCSIIVALFTASVRCQWSVGYGLPLRFMLC